MHKELGYSDIEIAERNLYRHPKRFKSFQEMRRFFMINNFIAIPRDKFWNDATFICSAFGYANTLRSIFYLKNVCDRSRCNLKRALRCAIIRYEITNAGYHVWNSSRRKAYKDIIKFLKLNLDNHI